MKSNYIILILFFVLVAKSILVDTPSGKRLDFSRLPHIGSELTRSFESITRGLFKLANKCGIETPPSMGQCVEQAHNKREATIRQRNTDGWSAVNVTDPAQIQACVEIWGPHPEGPRKLGDWRSALGCSASEANQWRELSPDLLRLVEWKKEGMSPEDTAGWFSNRSVIPNEAKNWQSEGFPSEIASTWRNLGYSPQEARAQSYGATLSVPDARALDEQCARSDINPQALNLEPWIDAGFVGTRLVLVPHWVSLGFNPAEAMSWDLPPSASAEWRGLGCTALESKQWLSAKPTLSATTAFEWKSAGFDSTDFQNWSTSELEFAVNWCAAGVHSEIEASTWQKEGFSLNAAQDWKSNGLNSAAVSKTWQDNGFSAIEAAIWTKNGITAERATVWTSHGYTEPRLVSNVNLMVKDSETLQALLHSGKTLSEIEAELYSSPGDIGFTNK
jgi:hypothetical protein